MIQAKIWDVYFKAPPLDGSSKSNNFQPPLIHVGFLVEEEMTVDEVVQLCSYYFIFARYVDIKF